VKPRLQLLMHTMAMTVLLNGRSGRLAAANQIRSPLRLHLAARPVRSLSMFQRRNNSALSGASAQLDIPQLVLLLADPAQRACLYTTATAVL
jgi:hypothetical protein